MSKAKTKSTNTVEIHVEPLKRGSLTLRIIGTTPLIQNRMSAKVKQALLVGSRKKTSAERLSIKHSPFDEYRDAIEQLRSGSTAVGLRVVAVKAAMCTAAVDTAGTTKAGSQRLLFMPGDFFELYGVPQIRMDVTRSADMNRTPDVRTRPIFERWGAEVEVHYVVPQLSAKSVTSLLMNAGMLCGVGDYRQEKGKGAFGSFRVIDARSKDEEWSELVKHGGRKAQLAAIEDPEPFDRETEELLAFFQEEVNRRAA